MDGNAPGSLVPVPRFNHLSHIGLLQVGRQSCQICTWVGWFLKHRFPCVGKEVDWPKESKLWVTIHFWETSSFPATSFPLWSLGSKATSPQAAAEGEALFKSQPSGFHSALQRSSQYCLSFSVLTPWDPVECIAFKFSTGSSRTDERNAELMTGESSAEVSPERLGGSC